MKNKKGEELSAGCAVYDPEFKESGHAGRVEGGRLYVAFDKFDKFYTADEAARLEIEGWEDPEDLGL